MWNVSTLYFNKKIVALCSHFMHKALRRIKGTKRKALNIETERWQWKVILKCERHENENWFVSYDRWKMNREILPEVRFYSYQVYSNIW